jgi:hypothetical protein
MHLQLQTTIKTVAFVTFITWPSAHDPAVADWRGELHFFARLKICIV